MSQSSYLVDVHTHLTDERFAADLVAVIDRAIAAGVGALVVNGLEPHSNRAVLDLAKRFPVVKPALGIYPIDAVHPYLPADFPLKVEPFDLDAELEFIRARALAGELAAIGECGLDGHWLKAELLPHQEVVFRRLIAIALEADLPVIVHSRKFETRCAEILREMGAQKVDFHCFGGKTQLAKRWAEQDGWWFSIPANAQKSESFSKMLATLPPERLLTETDAPYLAPIRGERNEPAHVALTVAHLANLRGWTIDTAQERIHANYVALFGSRWS